MRVPFRKPGKYSRTTPDPLLTKQKFFELQGKLERLYARRPQLVAEVARLAETGDFSENAGYQNAKGRLRGLNNAILALEEQLRRAEILTPPAHSDTVQIGSTVILKHGVLEKTYQILGSTETNPARGVISYTSPLGAAILGHRVGETILVKLGNREMEYIIMKIE